MPPRRQLSRKLAAAEVAAVATTSKTPASKKAARPKSRVSRGATSLEAEIEQATALLQSVTAGTAGPSGAGPSTAALEAGGDTAPLDEAEAMVDGYAPEGSQDNSVQPGMSKDAMEGGASSEQDEERQRLVGRGPPAASRLKPSQEGAAARACRAVAQATLKQQAKERQKQELAQQQKQVKEEFVAWLKAEAVRSEEEETIRIARCAQPRRLPSHWRTTHARRPPVCQGLADPGGARQEAARAGVRRG